MATKKLTRDDRMDIAIDIVNELVSLGHMSHCTDFDVLNLIECILKESKLRKKEEVVLNNISKEDYIIWDNEKNEPSERLDIIYHYTSLVELLNDGLQFGVNEEIRCVAELPLKWQINYNKAIENCK
jgi:hypothetical protein